MPIEPQPPMDEVVSLLDHCGLPVSDITPPSPAQFFGIHQDGILAAVIGLELYPDVGLLRSLAVAPSCRGRGFARKLVAFAESFAASRGVASLFLLTTDKAEFFQKLGYSTVSRNAAPPAIQTSSQFSGLCPASSAFLSKNIAVA